jgi:hypothetical protein
MNTFWSIKFIYRILHIIIYVIEPRRKIELFKINCFMSLKLMKRTAEPHAKANSLRKLQIFSEGCSNNLLKDVRGES